MAPSTDCLLTRDLMFDAVPNSSASIFCTRDTCERDDIGQHKWELNFCCRLNTNLVCISVMGWQQWWTAGARIHLILGRHDQADHGCAVSTSCLQALDELRLRQHDNCSVSSTIVAIASPSTILLSRALWQDT